MEWNSLLESYRTLWELLTVCCHLVISWWNAAVVNAEVDFERYRVKRRMCTTWLFVLLFFEKLEQSMRERILSCLQRFPWMLRAGWFWGWSEVRFLWSRDVQRIWIVRILSISVIFIFISCKCKFKYIFLYRICGNKLLVLEINWILVCLACFSIDLNICSDIHPSCISQS